MKIRCPESIRQYILQFAERYHKYKIEAHKLHKSKYYICSTLSHYKKTGLIQLAYNDKPGDLLPVMTISEIKHTLDILSGLHPIDVNSINDIYYLSQDKISELIIKDDFIQVTNKNGMTIKYDLNESIDHENLISKRVFFLIGYIQAEKLIRKNFSNINEKYKIIKDHITTLHVIDLDTKESFLRNPLDILFSNEYQYFSKEDISRIGYICGQMGHFQSNERMA